MLPGFDPGPKQAHARDIAAQGMAEAGSAADYANRMWGAISGTAPAKAHEGIEASLKHAAESYFYLGQVIAMPSLADAPRRVREQAPAEGGPRSFLGTMIRAYPQVAQRRRGGALSGIGGGLLGGLIGGEILGGLGGWGDSDGGGFF